MKVIVSATGRDLDSEVDPRFGRAARFIAVDPDTLEFEVLENTQNLQASQGAGIQAATLVARHKPAAVLTGNCGPKAFQTLRAAGISVVVGVSGVVRNVVEKYRKGGYSHAAAANVEGHWM